MPRPAPATRPGATDLARRPGGPSRRCSARSPAHAARGPRRARPGGSSARPPGPGVAGDALRRARRARAGPGGRYHRASSTCGSCATRWWTRRASPRLVERAKAMHVRGLLVQVVGRGDAWYRSDLLPRTRGAARAPAATRSGELLPLRPRGGPRGARVGQLLPGVVGAAPPRRSRPRRERAPRVGRAPARTAAR